jgi:transposase
MAEARRLNVGVDVSKDSLDVAYWETDESVFQGKFPNTKKGFQTIAQKIEAKCQETNTTSVFIVMEPTGGYEQPLARFAIQQQWQVSLPNPYRVKQWAGAMGIRAKTDRHDARTLAHYGFMQDPHQWKPLPPEVEELKHLLDRLDDLHDALNRERNRLDSYQYQANPHKAAYRSLKQSIAFLERQIAQVQKSIKEHLKAHPHLKEQKKLLLSVSGVGEKNVLYILVMMHRWEALTEGKGEASGLVAYVGLDPKPHESGTSIRKRAGISRQGNRPFRSRLYMSALGGVGGNNPLRAFYKRLVGLGKPKKVALVAAARKILIWCWAVFRSNTPFDTARFGCSQ